MVGTKSERRYKYFKDAQAAVATFTSAMIVAVVAFVAQIKLVSDKWLLVIGLTCLFVSLITQLTMYISWYIGSGFNDYWIESGFAHEGSGKDAKIWGRISGAALLVSYLFTFIGFAFVCIFLVMNI